MAKRYMATDDRPSILRGKEITCKEIFAAAEAGDAVAAAALETVYARLAEFCANLASAFDPAVIVLGGGVSKAGNVLIDGIRRHFGKYVFHAMADMPFVIATLGNDAGAYGAFKLILDAYA